MAKGSIALVGSGEFLPEMSDLENLLIQDGVRNGKVPRFIQIQQQQAKKAQSASSIGKS